VSEPSIKIQVDSITKIYRTVQTEESFIQRLFPIGKRTELEVKALDSIDLDIHAGEFVSIVGPSGCGKTTLLRIMHGLVKANSGQVRINGEVVTEPRPECGFVFQNFGLYPWRSVMDNVAFGLELQNVEQKERYKRAQEFINMVGLAGFESSYPHQLSGGMQQRVGLARTLAIEPQILLMDEPFGALDAQTKRIMQLELLRILQEQGNVSTVVFVTHDLEEALLLSDKVVVMTRRPGRCKEIINVPFPHPRQEVIMDTSEFIQLRRHLWDTLKVEQVIAEQ
jgi:ABC-type nitrate/sulfonate/bicarbonate transport system ATPase subunit